MMEVIFKDTANADNNSHIWAMGYTDMKGLKCEITPKLREQTTTIIKQLRTNRNWIIMISDSTIHIQKLYRSISIAHAFTNRKTSKIIDPADLISVFFSKDSEEKREKIEELENCDLLMVNYIDNKNQGLSKIAGNLQSIFRNRKMDKKPTIFEVSTYDLADTGTITMNSLRQLSMVYGKPMMDILRDDIKYIKVNAR